MHMSMKRTPLLLSLVIVLLCVRLFTLSGENERLKRDVGEYQCNLEEIKMHEQVSTFGNIVL